MRSTRSRATDFRSWPETPAGRFAHRVRSMPIAIPQSAHCRLLRWCTEDLPLRLGLPVLVKIVEMVEALRGSDEQRAPEPVAEGRPEHLGPGFRSHRGIFV